MFGNCMTTQTLNIALKMYEGRNYVQTNRWTIRLLDHAPPVDLSGWGQKIFLMHVNKLQTKKKQILDMKAQSPDGSKVMANVKVFLRYVPVGQRSRSRSQGQSFWYEQKGLITKNVNLKYECLTFNGSKVTANVRFFRFVGHRSWSKSLGQNFGMNRKASS